MLKLLLKKQLAEVFKSYFYDAKKNKMRSKAGVVGFFIFFVLIMVGMLGGMFTMLSFTLCGTLTMSGMGWLYFVLMGNIAILLGAFGSVFNTYSGLYLAKDNDLLLSLPIPVDTIMASRLLNVYLMGTMYSLTALIPTLIVYWIVAGVTAARVICGVLFMLIVTLIVLTLSCVLGWAVAKISLRLKNKSFITVFVALAFIAAYYFFYFKANDLIRDLLANAEVYGAKIKGAVYGLYLFGRIGEGDWLPAVLFTVGTAAIFVLVWTVLHRSFLKIATSSGNVEKKQYVEKAVRQRSPFRALLAKEFGRFTSSANYMLNCGLGVLLIPACGVLLLIKGREFCAVLAEVFTGRPGTVIVLICTSVAVLSSMNDMVVPSVSLEGKSLWIPQSLPLRTQIVLRAKLTMQLLLTLIPILFTCVCAALVVEAALVERLLLIVMPLIYAVFTAAAGLFFGIRMPILNWTDETAPIKQSGAAMIYIFGGWAMSLLLAGGYLLIGYKIGATVYLLGWTVVLAIVALLLLRWIDTKGAKMFEAL